MPLYTDFTFDDPGIPKNPENPVYEYDPGDIDQNRELFLSTRNNYKSKADENI